MSKTNKILLTLGITTIIFILGYGLIKSYSKYNNNIEGQATVDAAVGITKDNMFQTLNVELDSIVPGDTKTYNFAVTNYDTSTSKLNEVTMEYTIEIEKSDNIPVDIVLYKDSVNTNILDNDLKTSGQRFGFSEEQTHNYSLIISWDSSNNSYEYNDLTDYLDIKIHSEQITS